MLHTTCNVLSFSILQKSVRTPYSLKTARRADFAKLLIPNIIGMGWSGLLSPTTRTGMPLYDLSCFKERQGQNERDSAIR